MRNETVMSHVLRDHVLGGGLAALGLWPWLGPAGSLQFWLANLLIDADHYLVFVWQGKFRKWGIVSMFRFYEEIFKRRHQHDFLSVNLFHTVEFLAVFSLLAWRYGLFLLPAVYGAWFHMGVDFIHLLRHRVFRKRTLSLLEYFWRARQMLIQAKDPNRIFAEAFEAAN